MSGRADRRGGSALAAHRVEQSRPFLSAIERSPSAHQWCSGEWDSGPNGGRNGHHGSSAQRAGPVAGRRTPQPRSDPGRGHRGARRARCRRSGRGDRARRGCRDRPLYRRFPDRDALIRAVAQDTLHKALAEARAAVAEEATAWAALVRFLGQSRQLRMAVRLTMDSPGVHAAMRDDPDTVELRRAMLDVLDGVVHAARAECSLRADVGTGDVATAFVMLVRPLMLPDPDLASVALERCLVVMLDGLRAGSGSPLPGTPIGRADLGP